jgi:iron(III) transport system ATP-binding protein
VSALEISGLVKSFGKTDKVRAVNSINLVVDAGEMLVLLGPSGCGKTTLLRCVAGLEIAQEGVISLGNRTVFDSARRIDVPPHRRDIGMVFQNYSLWPHMTVERNVDYPLRARRVPAQERAMRTREMLDVVHCGGLADRLPMMLSGGQQQRVALARALAPRPSLMLLDEPLSNLDVLLRDELRQQLRSIHRELGFSGIYVTHDQTEAFTIGTRVAVMNSGRIEQLGTATEVNSRPATEYVARFLGIRNTLSISYDGGWESSGGPLRGDLEGLPRVDHPLQLYARSEDLVLAKRDAGLTDKLICLGEALVADAATVGHENVYIATVGETTVEIRRPRAEPKWQAGDHAELHARQEDILLYDSGALLVG